MMISERKNLPSMYGSLKLGFRWKMMGREIEDEAEKMGRLQEWINGILRWEAMRLM